MPARQRSAKAPEPITVEETAGNGASLPPASNVTGATKRDSETWQSVIRMVENHIAKEPDANRLENMRAVLTFIQEHGYPEGNICDETDPEFCIWAMDGVVRCQTKVEFLSQPWMLPSPGFNGRGKEGYCVQPPRHSH